MRTQKMLLGQWLKLFAYSWPNYPHSAGEWARGETLQCEREGWRRVRREGGWLDTAEQTTTFCPALVAVYYCYLMFIVRRTRRDMWVVSGGITPSLSEALGKGLLAMYIRWRYTTRPTKETRRTSEEIARQSGTLNTDHRN